MAADITGFTVLVTGGSSGLGRAVVHRLADAGAVPFVLDVTPPPAPFQGVAVDVADAEAVEQAVASVVAHTGRLDAVVTCAGLDHPGPIDQVAWPDWERVVAVNLLGTAAVVRAALPELRHRRGRIVTVASTLGHRAVGDATAYCASKFGVVGFTRALTAELAGQVGVTLITPGGMDTAFFDDRAEQYRPGADARLADPFQVADAVLYALTRHPEAEVRELVITVPTEPSWP